MAEEKTYECDYCHKVFTTKKNLDFHKRLYGGYHCSYEIFEIIVNHNPDDFEKIKKLNLTNEELSEYPTRMIRSISPRKWKINQSFLTRIPPKPSDRYMFGLLRHQIWLLDKFKMLIAMGGEPSEQQIKYLSDLKNQFPYMLYKPFVEKVDDVLRDISEMSIQKRLNLARLNKKLSGDYKSGKFNDPLSNVLTFLFKKSKSKKSKKSKKKSIKRPSRHTRKSVSNKK